MTEPMTEKLISLARALYTISRIPVRIIQGDKQISSFPEDGFRPDPCSSCLNAILSQSDFVNLYSTKNLLFYGTVKKDDFTLLFGPVGRIRMDEASLTRELFELGQPRERLKELKAYFDDIPSGIEIVKFAEILCDVNSCLNNVKVSPYEISVFDAFSENEEPMQVYSELRTSLNAIEDANYGEDESYTTKNIRKSYEFEQNMLHFITHGEKDKLKELMEDSVTHAVTTGKLAHDNLRQLKNELICLAVLASRAAIKGGLDVELSYSLCNIYIQKIEKAYMFRDLSELSGQIFYDYSTRVQELHAGNGTSPIVDRTIRYITRNINQKIFVEEIAKHLKVNRSYLSVKFKAETGMSVSDFITKQKIIEAQRLLRNTDKSLLQISNYLDFSSQSYFQLQFKKYTGMTPLQYRQNK